MAKVLKLEQRLWSAADQLRANSNLKSSEYSQPVLGLIFLRFADAKFSKAEKELNITNVANGKKIKELTVDDYQARGVMYLPENARYSYLLGLPEEENIGRAINEAMKSVEEVNPDLKGVLPKTYTKIADEIYYNWICLTQSEKGPKACCSKIVPEYEMKLTASQVLQLENFDSDVFDKQIEKVVPIGEDILEFHFYDGRVVKQEWHSHARTRCWTEERKKKWGQEIKKRWKDGVYVKEC